MCDQTEVKYLPNDIVWVKFSSLWWPAEVQDQDTLDEDVTAGLKNKPFAVVKFFGEDYYEFVKNLDQIYHYNCFKKNEFIRKGLDKSRPAPGKHIPSNMKKFPGDVQIAERRTGGDPNIIHDPIFLPEEKVDYSPLFPSTSKKQKNKKRVTIGPIETPKPKQPRKSLPNPTPIICTPRPKNDDVPLTSGVIRRNDGRPDFKSVVLIQKSPKTSSPRYQCSRCTYNTERLALYVMHHKFHMDSKSWYGFSPTPSTPKTNEKVPKRKTPDSPRDNSSPKPKKKKTPVKCDVPPKKRTKKAKAQEEEPKKLNEALRENILKDWEDDEEDDSLPFESTIEEASGPEGPKEAVEASGEEKLTKEDVKEDSDKIEEADKRDSEKSCFDFEDNDDSINLDKSLKFGQKLPRVISPERTKKQSEKADEKSDNVTEEDKVDDSADNFYKQFENLLEETKVPEISPVLPSTVERVKETLTMNDETPQDMDKNGEDDQHETQLPPVETPVKPATSEITKFSNDFFDQNEPVSTRPKTKGPLSPGSPEPVIEKSAKKPPKSDLKEESKKSFQHSPPPKRRSTRGRPSSDGENEPMAELKDEIEKNEVSLETEPQVSEASTDSALKNGSKKPPVQSSKEVLPKRRSARGKSSFDTDSEPMSKLKDDQMEGNVAQLEPLMPTDSTDVASKKESKKPVNQHKDSTDLTSKKESKKPVDSNKEVPQRRRSTRGGRTDADDEPKEDSHEKNDIQLKAEPKTPVDSIDKDTRKEPEKPLEQGEEAPPRRKSTRGRTGRDSEAEPVTEPKDDPIEKSDGQLETEPTILEEDSTALEKSNAANEPDKALSCVRSSQRIKRRLSKSQDDDVQPKKETKKTKHAPKEETEEKFNEKPEDVTPRKKKVPAESRSKSAKPADDVLDPIDAEVTPIIHTQLEPETKEESEAVIPPNESETKTADTVAQEVSSCRPQTDMKEETTSDVTNLESVKPSDQLSETTLVASSLVVSAPESSSGTIHSDAEIVSERSDTQIEADSSAAAAVESDPDATNVRDDCKQSVEENAETKKEPSPEKSVPEVLQPVNEEVKMEAQVESQIAEPVSEPAPDPKPSDSVDRPDMMFDINSMPVVYEEDLIQDIKTSSATIKVGDINFPSAITIPTQSSTPPIKKDMVIQAPVVSTSNTPIKTSVVGKRVDPKRAVGQNPPMKQVRITFRTGETPPPSMPGKQVITIPGVAAKAAAAAAIKQKEFVPKIVPVTNPRVASSTSLMPKPAGKNQYVVIKQPGGSTQKYIVANPQLRGATSQQTVSSSIQQQGGKLMLVTGSGGTGSRLVPLVQSSKSLPNKVVATRVINSKGQITQVSPIAGSSTARQVVISTTPKNILANAKSGVQLAKSAGQTLLAGGAKNIVKTTQIGGKKLQIVSGTKSILPGKPIMKKQVTGQVKNIAYIQTSQGLIQVPSGQTKVNQVETVGSKAPRQGPNILQRTPRRTMLKAPAKPVVQVQPAIESSEVILNNLPIATSQDNVVVFSTVDAQGNYQPIDSSVISVDSGNQMFIDPSSIANGGLIYVENGSQLAKSTATAAPTQDILAKALANTQVLSNDSSEGLDEQMYVDTQYPSLSHNVLETSLTLNQPIMTPIEQPSISQQSLTPAIPQISTIPSNLLPIQTDKKEQPSMPLLTDELDMSGSTVYLTPDSALSQQLTFQLVNENIVVSQAPEATSTAEVLLDPEFSQGEIVFSTDEYSNKVTEISKDDSVETVQESTKEPTLEDSSKVECSSSEVQSMTTDTLGSTAESSDPERSTDAR